MRQEHLDVRTADGIARVAMNRPDTQNSPVSLSASFSCLRVIPS